MPRSGAVRPASHELAPAADEFFRGEMRLLANTQTLLGGDEENAAGRIPVAVPTEAARGPNYLLEIARRTADVVRINCAHDQPAAWGAMIQNARQAGNAAGRRIGVLTDIAGPSSVSPRSNDSRASVCLRAIGSVQS